MNSLPLRSTELRLLLALVIILPCGCLPLPPIAKVGSANRPPVTLIEKLLIPGRLKSDVIEELGRPFLEIHQGRIIGYTWDTKTADGFYFYPGSDNNKMEWSRSSWLLLIAFDESGQVLAYQRRPFENGDPIIAQAEAWLRRIENNPPPSPAR